jgi:hypothetical protein
MSEQLKKRVLTKYDLPADVVEQIKRNTPKLHDLGQVALSEFLCEIVAGGDVMARLEVYSKLHSTFTRDHAGTLLPDALDKLAKK